MGVLTECPLLVYHGVMDTTTGTRTVAQIVKEANRSEVHRRTGISLPGVSRILSGDRNARVVNLKAIALVLGVTMDDLHNHLATLAAKRAKRRNQAA